MASPASLRRGRAPARCYTAAACPASNPTCFRSRPIRRGGATGRPCFHPWATWLSTALVVLLVGYVFALTPSDPLEHLRWPEDSLERLAGRDMEMRAAMARAPRWERQLYAFLSGGEESVDDWVRWHEELAQVSGSPDVELDRLILLGEAGRTAAVREDVEE